ncbi:MAG TPA: GAF and ANTAR domain-containing protein [Aquihabitans sp.]|nr:GAF and ANTAR domain-containing protein [Aquihabitans sp.]
MDDLAHYFADFARRLHEVDAVDDTMGLIVATAVEAIDGCEHASLSYTRGKQLISASSNDEIGPMLDQAQTEAQQGPCLDAIREGSVFVADDLALDERWPVYGPRAVEEAGVRSSLATPLRSGRVLIGALNLFSEELGTFTEDDEAQGALVGILVAHSAPALASALHKDDLSQALRSRDLIGQAKGVLMARSDIDEERAFEILVAASRRLNTKLVEVAQRLVDGTLHHQGGRLR